MKFKLIEENSSALFFSGTLLLSLTLAYILFAACFLGIIFFVLWNVGVSPVLGIAKIDIIASFLATLSLFSIFNFAHINIIKDNKRRGRCLRYSRYNLWLNIGLKVFVYLFASIPFIFLWNYAIPSIFSLELIKINLLQAILFIMSIRFICGLLLYSIAKEATSNRIVNNAAELFVECFNESHPEGTYVLSNKYVDEKAEQIDYIQKHCIEHRLAYRLGSIDTEYVAILCDENKKDTLNNITAVIFDEGIENNDWYQFYDLTEEDMEELDITEFNIYKCVTRVIN